MEKEVIKIAIVGHVDHGKSTLIGRLLLDTNSLPKGQIDEIRRVSKELGKETELAFITDQLREEREKSFTLDTTQIFFKTRKRNYAMIDTPGHVEFIKNMITGSTLAEAAILIVDIKEGITEEARRLIYIIKMLGICDLMVAVNKMDLVNYDEDRFNKIKDELLRLFKKIGIKPSFIIPISAKEGSGISRKYSNLNWHKGPTLLSAMDSLRISLSPADGPLRFPVQDIYNLDNENIIVGRIASGSLKTGQKVFIFPNRDKATIKALKKFGGRGKEEFLAGENVGLTLKEGLSVKRGDIISGEENAPKPQDRFKGDVFWISKETPEVNKTLILHSATQEVRCIVERIDETDGLLAKVLFKTERPIVLEYFSFIPELGRFAIEDDLKTKGIGIIKE